MYLKLIRHAKSIKPINKITIQLIAVIFILVSPGLISLQSATGPDKKMLTGMNYARIQCQMFGIPYYKALKTIESSQTEEFNVRQIESKLRENLSPIKTDNIRAIYSKLETLCTRQGILVPDIRPEDSQEKNSPSIVPTININFDSILTTNDNYVISITVTVEKWISTWDGSKNIKAPVIIWWQNKLVSTTSKDLFKSIDTQSDSLLLNLFAQIKNVNPPPETKTDTTAKAETKAETQTEQKIEAKTETEKPEKIKQVTPKKNSSQLKKKTPQKDTKKTSKKKKAKSKTTTKKKKKKK